MRVATVDGERYFSISDFIRELESHKGKYLEMGSDRMYKILHETLEQYRIPVGKNERRSIP